MNNAKRLRYEKGLDAPQVALGTGLSVQTIYRIEEGRNTSAPTAKKLADFYEVTVAELLGLDSLRDAA